MKGIRELSRIPFILVAHPLNLTNPGVVWDKFQIYQGRRRNAPYIQISPKSTKSSQLKFEKHPNAFKQALHYQDLLESGQADSQAELARLIGTPRSTIAAYLRLLGIDEEVRAEALQISDEDERVSCLTEARLRRLLVHEPTDQRRAFMALLDPTHAQEQS